MLRPPSPTCFRFARAGGHGVALLLRVSPPHGALEADLTTAWDEFGHCLRRICPLLETDLTTSIKRGHAAPPQYFAPSPHAACMLRACARGTHRPTRRLRLPRQTPAPGWLTLRPRSGRPVACRPAPSVPWTPQSARTSAPRWQRLPALSARSRLGLAGSQASQADRQTHRY